MAVKTRSELDKLSNPELVTYLNSLSKTEFNSNIDADTKVRFFLYLYGEGIAKFVKGTGYFFPAIAALKMFESGYGRSQLAQQAFNFGGVKYNPNKHSDFITMPTTEYVNGKQVTQNLKFAKFKDVEDGLKNNIGVLMLDRYKKAREATTPEEQIIAIVKGGYSTTPPNTYLNNMKGLIKRVAKKTGFGKIV